MSLEAATCEAWHAENRARAEALHADPGWQVAATGGGMQVERLRSAHPRGDYVRGSVELHTDLQVAADKLLLDQDAHVAWDPTLDRYVLHAELTAGATDHRLLQIPVLTGAHPLIRNRDLLYHEAIERSGDAVTTIGASREIDGVAPFAGHLRAWLGLSHRRVERIAPGRLRYSALWQTDMAGWLPRALVTSGQVKAMLAEHIEFASWWPAPG